MKGAIIFSVAFVVAFAVTLANNTISPGREIYTMLNLPNSDYLVANTVPATSLAISLINGVIYGFIAWFIFTMIWSFRKRKQTEHQSKS